MTTFQTGYKSFLSEYINDTATTIPVAVLPVATDGRMMLYSSPTTTEWISYTGISGSNPTGTLTGVTRGLSQTAVPSTGGTGLEWAAGTQIIGVQMHDQIADAQGSPTFTGTITAPDIRFSGTTTVGLRLKTLTTTQRDALTPATGDKIINSTTGTEQTYYGGTWNDNASGTTANASTTVAGKVEIATDAEITAGTGTGGTGAVLVPTPTQIKKSISLKNTVTSTSDTDTMVFNVAGEDKQMTQANFRESIPASTTLKGTVEMATDAEATTGTDQTRYINAKQAKDNYLPIFTSGVSTKNLADASTTQNIAHGLGRIPKNVKITLAAPVSYGFNSFIAFSTYNGTTQSSLGYYGDGTDLGYRTAQFSIGDSSTARYQTGVITFDATNITITWTKTGSPTGIFTLLWEAQT